MESEQPSFIKSTMNYGLITGIVLIAYSAVMYATGLESNDMLNKLSMVLLALSIYLTTKHYRDKKLGGYMSYGQGLKTGTMTGLFAAILLAFFVYLQFKFIDPSLLEKQLELAQTKLLEKGMSEDEVEKAMVYSKKLMTPGIMFITSIFAFGIYAFIISLVTSAILKKNKDSFASQMEGIDENN